MTDRWLDAGSPTTRLPSQTGRTLQHRAVQAARALAHAAELIPQAEARARDHAPGQPGAASYDAPRVGGSRSQSWCWTHERPTSDCVRDDLICDGEPIAVQDPTGEAAIAANAADLERQMKAALSKVERSVSELAVLVDSAMTLPTPPDDKARRDMALANDPDACEVCASHGHYEPLYRDTNPGGNLARKYRLGSFCWRWVVDTGKLPTAKQLTDHHVNARRVMRPA